ncbi:hypothetical protein DFH11DRAFT_1830243 [Phellopilus nigrolimitatus]|nr:hypothetical protein DFH11DRAFT_1830243 [Phellopilus nigrolimitatus]
MQNYGYYSPSPHRYLSPPWPYFFYASAFQNPYAVRPIHYVPVAPQFVQLGPFWKPSASANGHSSNASSRSSPINRERGLGQTFGYFWRGFDEWGKCPRAMKQKIERILMEIEFHATSSPTMREKEWMARQKERICRSCTKLLEYARSPSYEIQFQSLDALHRLVIQSPIVFECCHKVVAVRHLDAVQTSLTNPRRGTNSWEHLRQLKLKIADLLRVLRV